MDPWPHQLDNHTDCQGNWQAGMKCWSVVAPPGAGKSYNMRMLAIPAAERGKRVCLYSHRIMLTKQLQEGFRSEGVDVGVNAAGFEPNPEALIQICSLPTVYRRMGDYRYAFPLAELVIPDEFHQQTSEMGEAVFGRHIDQGARVVGFTATPVNLGGMAESLVQNATYGDLIRCGAHLPVDCFAPDCPDLEKVKTNANGDFSEGQDERLNHGPTIFGRVLEHYRKYNPSQLPAIGFAPSVAASRWYATERFRDQGIDCAHIDASRTVLVSRGKIQEYPTDASTREEVMRGSEEGRYKIVWNRFVLREAIDMPWLYHCILATSMGGLSTYLQSTGRVLRYFPEYKVLILQDHGGNVYRHSLPNIDRDWQLGDTNKTIHKREMKARQQSKQEDGLEPITCPKCGAARLSGPKCHSCGHLHKLSVRTVRETDGSLKKIRGRAVKHKAKKTFEEIFRSQLYGSYAANATVKQAYKLAKIKARNQGVKVHKTSFEEKMSKGDWTAKVREVYPWARPKHFRKH